MRNGKAILRMVLWGLVLPRDKSLVASLRFMSDATSVVETRNQAVFSNILSGELSFRQWNPELSIICSLFSPLLGSSE